VQRDGSLAPFIKNASQMCLGDSAKLLTLQGRPMMHYLLFSVNHVEFNNQLAV